jgi:hypothetical protein
VQPENVLHVIVLEFTLGEPVTVHCAMQLTENNKRKENNSKNDFIEAIYVKYNYADLRL